MKKEGNGSKYFFFGMIGLVAILGLIVIFPFISSVISGGILAFLFYPFYAWMLKRIKSRGVAAFITAILIVLIVTVPAILLVQHLTQESHYLYVRAKQQLFTGQLIETRCYDGGFLCKNINAANDLLKDENIKNYLIDRLNEALGFITKKVSEIIFSIPSIVLYLLVMLFTTYYVLKDGKEIIERIDRVAPLRVHHQEEIIKQFGEVTKAVIYGSFAVALIQGTLGAFGFWIFGISGFIWWGVIMALFALIPFVGTGIIWLPASIYLMLTGYLQGETLLVWKGLGLFFYGLLIISMVDNILKPIIVAGRAKVHPLLILIGILGGLFVFGFIGLIIGPLILALLQTMLEIYEREKTPHLTEHKADILGHVDGHKHKKKR